MEESGRAPIDGNTNVATIGDVNRREPINKTLKAIEDRQRSYADQKEPPASAEWFKRKRDVMKKGRHGVRAPADGL